ncbi:MAG TPA: 3'(2'),5'-bisphosphate nucleotidase CysQ [Acidobacteriaceae bacterium]|jgi:3'(2'), 5'-bisphosphate nucleotidase|nr:3'(2'),5'-bisphosphate nucleotidase CysQ [Acidobacteriaceae bacterium]
MAETRPDNWLCDLLPHVVTLAREAGRAVLQVYSEVNPAVEYKQDNSPLTQADMASHHIIVDGLARLKPNWPILSEESQEIPFEQRRAWQSYWLVDPLDGTREFLRRNGEFTINIALMEDRRPILGVVFAPAIDKLYSACRGGGAWVDHQASVSPIRTAKPGSGSTRVVVSRSHASGEERLEGFPELAGPCEYLVMGSSLKFCLVAEGAADFYPRTGPTMEWDTAAAQCVVEQAGGSVTDLEGNPMRYNKPVLLNPGFVVRGEG